jgi:hypothetical protein
MRFDYTVSFRPTAGKAAPTMKRPATESRLQEASDAAALRVWL